jgi:hypothetical protein
MRAAVCGGNGRPGGEGAGGGESERGEWVSGLGCMCITGLALWLRVVRFA